MVSVLVDVLCSLPPENVSGLHNDDVPQHCISTLREKIFGPRASHTVARCLSRPFMQLAPTIQRTMQHPPIMIPPAISRRSFLKASSALAGGAPLLAGLLKAQSAEAKRPLMAYVGTFSSPLRDVLPTQVDLPPGNGRGIHLFQVNRETGAMTAAVARPGRG
jgi:hypothetical protein